MYYYQRIRDLREDSDKTQAETAALLNIQTTTYRRYESGERKCPAHLIIQLAKLYRTTTDYILGLTNKR